VVSFSTITSYGWAARLGGSNGDYFFGVATDTSGNIYGVGYENSSTNGTNDEAIISKWDASGNLTWQRKIGGSYNDYFYGVACDASGAIYAVGYESSSAADNPSAFITKWDSSGNLTWQRRIGGSSTDLFQGVACDASGNIYAVGNEYSSNPGYSNAFITKWDASGNLIWQRKIGGSNHDYFCDVTIDASGNIYAVGDEYSSTGTNNEAFITKWDASGNLTWQRKLGGSNGDYFYGVTSDSSGNIYAVGYENSSNGVFEALITKWDASGNLTWQRKLGGQYDDYFYGVTSDSSGNIYAVGYSVISSNDEALITKWGSSGNLTWQRKIGGSVIDRFRGVTVDTSGNIYAVGSENTSVGTHDALITKWSSDVTNLPNGSLVGSGMTLLSIATPTLTVATPTLTASTPTLTAATTTLTASITTLSAATPIHTRYFSTF
jgi:uncharacterized delta-60 repeat protein